MTDDLGHEKLIWLSSEPRPPWIDVRMLSASNFVFVRQCKTSNSSELQVNKVCPVMEETAY